MNTEDNDTSPDYGPHSSSSPDGNGNGNGAGDVADTDIPIQVDAEVTEIPVSELKCELYAAAASANRGLSASPKTRVEIESLVEQLERARPAEFPLEQTAMLTGQWKLLYTNAFDVLVLGLLAPVAVVGTVFQNIMPAADGNVDEFDCENIVEFEPVIAPIGNRFFGQTMANLVVKARGKKKEPRSIALTFQTVGVQQQKLFGADVASVLPRLSAPLNQPVGEFEITYLDEDIRVARTALRDRPFGMFVLFRET